MATIHAKPYNQRTQCHLWCAGHFILMNSAKSIHSFIHSYTYSFIHQSYTLKVEAVGTSEPSVHFYRHSLA